MGSVRLQIWVLTLGAYNYHIRYKPGSSIAMLSPPDVPLPGEAISLLEQLESSPYHNLRNGLIKILSCQE